MNSVTKRLLLVLSFLLLGIRVVAARTVGFGDSEALYACYAMHPAPAYLDHPGLIGLFAQLVGSGGAPPPALAHAVTAILATAVPWLIVLAAQGAGADEEWALLAGIAALATPELAVGLFAMTPDLLLALAWIGSLGLAATALRGKPGDLTTASAFLGAGLLAGIATASKVTGGLLLVALVATYATRAAKAHRATLWPWAGIAAGLVVVAPIALFEAKTGWPMVVHRLVDTQGDAGFSLRNVGALVGGQATYLSPGLAVLAGVVGLDLVRQVRAHRDDVVTALLARTTFIPLLPLVAITLWSRVAEPHWIAPALLALPLHFARRAGDIPRLGQRVRRAATGLGLVFVGAVYAWVLVPQLARLAPASVDPRYDIANELFGWPDAVAAVRDVLAEEGPRGEIVVVGPHWTVCSQLHAALGPAVRVGCATPIRDDFDTWEPRARWRTADKLLFVSDNRFDVDTPKLFPGYEVAGRSRVSVLRGGRIARVFTLTLLEARAHAAR